MDQKKYYTVEEAAQILGTTPAEVNQRRERNELRGFRDGSNWKFKVEDIEAVVREARSGKPEPLPPAGEEAPDLLLSEVELGGSDSVVSGTVLGPAVRTTSDSDIQLADSQIEHAAIHIDGETSGTIAKMGGPGSVAMDITLDEDALLDEQQVDLSDEDSGTVANVPGPPLKPASPKPAAPAPPASKKPESSLNLGGGSSLALMGGSSLAMPSSGSGSKGKKLDDDDIVLGGSGSGSSGSDITIGGDSGISLLDPTDSGLSLEEPLELERMDEDSLELGEDDMLTFSEDTGSTETPAVKKDEEFLLTPLEEAPDEEGSASGSQVIALDAGAGSDKTATMVSPTDGSLGVGAGAGMAAMLEEDFGATPAAAPVFQATPGFAAGPAAAIGAPAAGVGQPMYSPEGVPVGVGAMAIPEAPYSALNVTALICCLILLLLCCVIAFDLMRNMWSWNGTYPVNSWLMDKILGG